MMSKRVRNLGGAALLLAGAFTVVLVAFNRAAFWDWGITFVATLVSVVFAVALFWYQREKNDNERQEQLLTALSAEAQVCMKILNEPRDQLSTLGGKDLGRTVLTPLPTTVIDEAIRSGLHDPRYTYLLILMASQLRAHNSDVEACMSTQTVEVNPAVVLGIMERMEERLMVIKENCRNLVKNLEEQSIPQPETSLIHSEQLGEDEAPDAGGGAQEGAERVSWWRRVFGA